MNRLRILVADDNQFMRTAYKRILETQDEFEVVCMAEDGAEALEMALELVPDVVILDVMMPKMDGIEAARQITDRHPQTGIVLLSAFDDLAFVSAIMKDGATRRAYDAIDLEAGTCFASNLSEPAHAVFERVRPFFERYAAVVVGGSFGGRRYV